jgi:hypothetical protein
VRKNAVMENAVGNAVKTLAIIAVGQMMNVV